MSNKNVFTFSLNKLTRMYFDRIKEDMSEVGPTLMMRKIISEYFLMKYGEQERKDIREEFINQCS